MKYTIIAATLFLSSTGIQAATPENCEAMSDFARIVLQARHRGVAQADMLNVVKEQFGSDATIYPGMVHMLNGLYTGDVYVDTTFYSKQEIVKITTQEILDTCLKAIK